MGYLFIDRKWPKNRIIRWPVFVCDYAEVFASVFAMSYAETGRYEMVN
jgi:hypothetical protein